MKLGVVVQRYGADINGGAELHARYIAERLSRHASVEVLSTCAKDYLTWKNEWPSCEETINGIRVRRFPVSRPRNTDDFGRRSQLEELRGRPCVRGQEGLNSIEQPFARKNLSLPPSLLPSRTCSLRNGPVRRFTIVWSIPPMTQSLAVPLPKENIALEGFFCYHRR